MADKRNKYLIAIGLSSVILGLAIVFLAVRAVDNFIHMGQRAKRSEAPQNLRLIREAELEYFKSKGRYFPFDIPTDYRDNSDGVRLESHTHPAWTELGFQPEYRVRCDYKVAVTQDPDDFRATVQCDVDGDGEFAVYSATSTSEVERLTDGDVY